MELDYISVDSVTKWCDIVWARNASNKSGSCVNIKSTKCSTQSNNSIWIKEKKLYICVPQHFVTTESDNIGGQSVLFNQWITNKFVHAHGQSQLKHRDASQEQRRNWIRRKNQSVVQRKLWLRLAYVSHARVVTRISRWRNSVREQQFLVVPHDYLWIRKMCVFICQKRVAPMCTLRYKNIHKCAGFGYEANDSCRSDGVVLVRAIRSHRHPRLWMRVAHTHSHRILFIVCVCRQRALRAEPTSKMSRKINRLKTFTHDLDAGSRNAIDGIGVGEQGECVNSIFNGIALVRIATTIEVGTRFPFWNRHRKHIAADVSCDTHLLHVHVSTRQRNVRRHCLIENLCPDSGQPTSIY